MREKVSRLNPQWIRQARDYFRGFLEETGFPSPVRNGSRESEFSYPEWLIMFIAIMSVRCKIKTYQGIHRMALEYWEVITEGMESIKPISESQLRGRLKKSATHLESQQVLFFRYFLRKHSITKVSADKMMVKVKGPVWHKKQKREGIVPQGLRGLDKEATWGRSGYDGWVYGHGSFCITSYDVPIVGVFKWMPNSGDEAKLMEVEVGKLEGVVKKVFMDSRADDQKPYGGLKQQRGMQLVTVPRKGMDKLESRKQMIQEMLTEENKSDYRKRSTTVEPMQGVVKEIFELDNCWMRGNVNNRWLFAAMGVSIQIAQWRALNQKSSTWQIKSRVLGI